MEKYCGCCDPCCWRRPGPASGPMAAPSVTCAGSRSLASNFGRPIFRPHSFLKVKLVRMGLDLLLVASFPARRIFCRLQPRHPPVALEARLPAESTSSRPGGGGHNGMAMPPGRALSSLPSLSLHSSPLPSSLPSSSDAALSWRLPARLFPVDPGLDGDSSSASAVTSTALCDMPSRFARAAFVTLASSAGAPSSERVFLAARCLFFFLLLRVASPSSSALGRGSPNGACASSSWIARAAGANGLARLGDSSQPPAASSSVTIPRCWLWPELASPAAGSESDPDSDPKAAKPLGGMVLVEAGEGAFLTCPVFRRCSLSASLRR
mmetsp:Transcript_88104/g.254158  ORF Transcript_88104/g.254158 Transcript_88104/m.254158 type:complete len:323 (-) Transcript_88104:506-1474(-)